MDINTLWSAALSLVMGALWFFIRERLDDIKRIERLLNITREEIARDTATKAEVARVTDHIDQRFNKLEEKIDRLLQAGK
jgi:predicted transcriptional regulator